MPSLFRDRREAGLVLAERVLRVVRDDDVLVLGLPNGGVAVGYEIARALDATLDVLVLRPLDVPRPPAIVGAIAAGGVRVLDGAAIARLGIPSGTIDQIARREAVELTRRERYYRESRPSPRMRGRPIVLADDGLTTEASLRWALDALAVYRPASVLVALPAASAGLEAELRRRAVTIVAHTTAGSAPDLYEHASPPSDRDVRQMLAHGAVREHHELAG